MKPRKWQRSGLGVGLVVMLGGLLALVNYISARHVNHRFDLTRNRDFTVAEPTRRILGELDDIVNVKAYFSKQLPDQVASMPARVRDVLSEFETYARGNLRVEYVDPDGDADLEAKVRALGIPKVPITVAARNKQETVSVYLGIAVLYGDKTAVIPFVGPNLEYELLSSILKVTRARKTVGFLTGHGEKDIYKDYRVVGEALRRQYNVEVVSVDAGKPIPMNISTLVVAGPHRRLTEWPRYQIDQYLMRGGGILFLLDAHVIDTAQLVSRRIYLELDEQLASYGVKVAPTLLADFALNEYVQVPGRGEQQLSYIVEYPLWPKIDSDNISTDHPVVSRLANLVLPWTAPLELTTPADPSTEVAVLARSTKLAYAYQDLTVLHPTAMPPPVEEEMAQYVLAAAVTGPLASFWTGKAAPTPPAPEPVEGAGPPPVGVEAAAATATATAAASSAALPTAPSLERLDHVASTRIVIVGTSELANDQLIGQDGFSSNLIFVLNAVDWLTVGDDLLGVRSRLTPPPVLDPERRPLGERYAPWINIALVPALVALFGLSWRAARKRRRMVFK